MNRRKFIGFAALAAIAAPFAPALVKKLTEDAEHETPRLDLDLKFESETPFADLMQELGEERAQFEWETRERPRHGTLAELKPSLCPGDILQVEFNRSRKVVCVFDGSNFVVLANHYYVRDLNRQGVLIGSSFVERQDSR